MYQRMSRIRHNSQAPPPPAAAAAATNNPVLAIAYFIGTWLTLGCGIADE